MKNVCYAIFKKQTKVMRLVLDKQHILDIYIPGSTSAQKETAPARNQDTKS